VISIQKAFKLRNEFKKQISDLTNLLNRAKLTYVEGESENTKVLLGLTCEETLKKIFTLQGQLMNLNIAIDVANVECIALVHKIRTIEVKVRQLKTMINNLKDLDDTTQVNTGEHDVRGNYIYVTKRLIPTLDLMELVEQVATLEKGKKKLEETLAEKNHTVMVDYDLSTID